MSDGVWIGNHTVLIRPRARLNKKYQNINNATLKN